MKRIFGLWASSLACFLWLPPTSLGQPVLWSANGHYYEFVRTNLITWYDARATAGTRAFAGLSAHLATVTSAAENEFIATNFFSGAAFEFAWLGGHAPNDQHDGRWQWEAGPEAGTPFSNFASATPPFNYANWGGAEPNHFQANENFLDMNVGAFFAGIETGQWGDAVPYPNERDPVVGYIVEYESVTPPALNYLTIQKVLLAYQLTFFAESNKRYQVQYVANAGDTNWQNLGNEVLGDGAIKAVFDATSDLVTQRFYRLQISQ